MELYAWGNYERIKERGKKAEMTCDFKTLYVHVHTFSPARAPDMQKCNQVVWFIICAVKSFITNTATKGYYDATEVWFF